MPIVPYRQLSTLANRSGSDFDTQRRLARRTLGVLQKRRLVSRLRAPLYPLHASVNARLLKLAAKIPG